MSDDPPPSDKTALRGASKKIGVTYAGDNAVSGASSEPVFDAAMDETVGEALRPLRVAVISAHTSPLARPGGGKTGGLNVYVRELCERLATLGCSIDIFSRATDRETPLVTQLSPTLRVIHLRAGPLRYLTPASVYKHLDAFEAALSAFVAGERTYDVIHSHYWLSGLVGERLSGAWGVPHVVMFHTLGEVKNRASHREHESALRISSEAAIIAGCDRVVCATELERTSLRQLYDADPGKVTVIPLGVDLDLFQPASKQDARAELGLSEDQHIVLFVGRIEPLKGVDILINAAAMLESDVDCAVMVVGGDDTARTQVARLRELARAKGIEGRVSFVGAVDHERLPLYYNAADVCVVPSHYESFGLVAVEAMASGVPVVASRVGGLTGTIRDGETGYLIPWLCPEPFAERIELLLDNDSLRRNLGEAAREEVARYRWENVTSAMLTLYRELTSKQAVGAL
jgi:D-inositol-3-phosphate glycosyltransferase